MDLSINKLAQKSARVDKKERDQAFESIKTILSSREGNNFNEIEFRKIWRGILYSFWLTDKLIVQVDYANRISELIHSFQQHENSIDQTILLMKTFYVELVNQWKNIDKHRLSKYLSLIRSFSRESFRFIFTTTNSTTIKEKIKKYNEMMISTPLSVTNFLGAGLQIQISCVFFPELSKIMKSMKNNNTSPIVVDHIIDLIIPYLELFVHTINVSIQKNIQERILDPLFTNNGNLFVEEEEEEEESEQLSLSVEHYKKLELFFKGKIEDGRSRNMGKCFEYQKKFSELVGVGDNDGNKILQSIEDELSKIEIMNMEGEKQKQKPQEEEETKQKKKKKKKNKKRKRRRKKNEEPKEEEESFHSPPLKKRKLD